MRCSNYKIDYFERLQIISGSVIVAGIVQFLFGATGIIGFISKRVGPLTITSLMILLCIGNCTIVLEKAQLHWISIIQFAFLLGKQARIAFSQIDGQSKNIEFDFIYFLTQKN